jgi:hypothetical protein
MLRPAYSTLRRVVRHSPKNYKGMSGSHTSVEYQDRAGACGLMRERATPWPGTPAYPYPCSRRHPSRSRHQSAALVGSLSEVSSLDLAAVLGGGSSSRRADENQSTALSRRWQTVDIIWTRARSTDTHMIDDQRTFSPSINWRGFILPAQLRFLAAGAELTRDSVLDRQEASCYAFCDALHAGRRRRGSAFSPRPTCDESGRQGGRVGSGCCVATRCGR